MSSSTQMCKVCNTSNRADAKFCKTCGAKIEESPSTGNLPKDYMVGQRFRIIELQGQGGMGAVYKAQDTKLGDALRAVKEMSQNELHGQKLQEAVRNFEQEAILLARLMHSNLPRIYDHVSEQGRYYLVMDFINGTTLEEHLEAHGKKLPVDEVLAIGIQLCSVLGYLHSQQPPIIFRDLSPDNIMLTADGTIYLIDFGIARFFKGGQAKDTTFLGKRGYAAPEQYGKSQTTPRTDIYALGANLHQMLSGAKPPDDRSFHFDALHLGNQSELIELESLIMRMVKREENERPASMLEVKQRLEEIRQSAKSLPPSSIARPIARPVQRSLSVIVAKSGGDYTSISAAIQAVAAGAHILVRPGTYHEGIVIDKPLEIVGDGSREQIIIESSNANCIKMQTDSATIRHLTIRGRASIRRMKYFAVDIPRGQLHLIDCDITSDTRPCIGVHSASATPIIQQCAIHDGIQGGIFVYDNGQGVIEDCDIVGNALAGIAIAQGGNPAIRNCKVLGGTDTGISIYESGEGIIEDCDIVGNTGVGIEIREQGKPIIRNCKVHDGEQSGIEVYENGQGLIEDCEVFGNTGPGIAIRNWGKPIIRNCKVYNGAQSGITVYEDGQGIIEACDISGNADAGIAIRARGNPTIRYCKVYDGETCGILVNESGQGMIEDCDIFDNAYTGVEIREGGNPRFTRCNITDNSYQAVWVHDQGLGTIEDCDLTGNQDGAWKISRDSRVRRSKNRV